MCVGFWPSPEAPSPKVQAHEEGAPVEEPLKLTVSGATPVVPSAVESTVSGSAAKAAGTTERRGDTTVASARPPTSRVASATGRPIDVRTLATVRIAATPRHASIPRRVTATHDADGCLASLPFRRTAHYHPVGPWAGRQLGLRACTTPEPFTRERFRPGGRPRSAGGSAVFQHE